MKISVDRTENPQGDLVFTITVKDPHAVPFTDEERISLEGMEELIRSMEQRLDPVGLLYQDILNANHHVKGKVFTRVLDNLKFAIENEFRPKFKPICQEIYNWIYDKQQGYVKQWMIEFDPQRTKFYFDNDEKMKAQFNPVASDPDWGDDDE